MDYRIDRCIDLFGFSFIVKSSDIWKYRFYFCFYNTFILGFIDAINFRAKCFNAGDAEVSLFGEGQCSWQCSRFNIYHTVILFLEDRCYCPCFIVFECFDFILSYIYARKIKIEKEEITITDIKVEGRDMLKMGVLISLQGMLAILASYFIRTFISRMGSIDDVGLFNAGFTIVNTYVGLVFTAMATDYYPRLSAIASDNDSFVRAINQQAEISLLLLAPIIIAFIAYIRVAVVVLYSTKFIPTEGMMYWAMAAMFFKAMAWSMSYGLLAKGDSKVYFWNEFITVCYGLIFNMIGYLLLGINRTWHIIIH